MEFRLLGPVEMWHAGRRVDIGHAKQRSVLAVLLIEAGRVTPTAMLVDRVWGHEPPDGALNVLYSYLTRLRKALAPVGAAPTRRSGGYLLDVDPETVDVHRFRRLLAEAKTSEDGLATAMLDEALALWRGTPFADESGPWLVNIRETLVEQRLAALVTRHEAYLSARRSTELIGQLRPLVAEYPLDERLVGQLMLAFYRSGRASDALDEYRHLRQRLVDSLGCDPSRSLRQLHQRILRDDPTLTDAPPAPATCTLPVDTAVFTGRGKELHDVTTVVTAAAEAGRVVAIHAIDGMPGVGKTALAVHVGHRLADRFPDRQLFVDLHAHTPGQRPTTPADALASLLSADGVDARYLPDGLEERATLWRSRMAHKQVLLILDNAASSDQVTPLLPGSAGCLVLVTSRRFLGDLPSAVPVPLDVLPAEEAQQMFLRLAPRAAAEPGNVAELVGLCGHLPLAILLLARLFSTHRSWSMDDLISETTTTLLTTAAESRTVAAAFDLSYQYLPTDRQRFFRYLGLHPGVDIDAHAAAALTGLSLDEAGEHLDALYRDHLIDEPVYRRYRMHDLIRDYVRTLAVTDPADERDDALEQLLDYYQHAAALADAHLARHPSPATTTPAAPPAAAPGLASRSQALAWVRTERANLLACLEYVTHHAQHARVVGLTAGVVSLLRSDGPWAQAVDLHAQAAAAARHLGDRLGEGTALRELGVVRRLTGDYSGATEVLEQALGLYRDLGERLGEANTLNDLGIVQGMTGHYPGATEALKQALGLYRDLGERLGEANALNSLGGLRLATDDYPDAAQVLEQALGLYRDLGERLGEANALNYLGIVRRVTGDYSGAAEVLERALGLYRDLGDRIGEANALNDLGVVRRLTGDYSGAAEVLERALGLYRDIGDRLGEAEVLNQNGMLCLESGDREQALAYHQRALDLARTVNSPLEQAHALDGVGRCALAGDDTATAVTELRQALEIYQRLGAAEAIPLATELTDLDAG